MKHCKLVVVAALLAALTTQPAHACLHYIEDSALAPSVPPTLSERLLQHLGRGDWQARVDYWRPIAAKEYTFASQNNLVVALAHTGQFDEALRRLQTIERVSPGHDYTAYNIATVYELQGDLPRALKWVKTGLERERGGHSRHDLDNTEWLHERILEARLRARYAPESLGAASIAGLDFGASIQPQPPTISARDEMGRPYDAPTLKRALWEQTHERLEFVPAPDPVVADLLLDVANFAYYEGQTEDAQGVYQLALQYSPRRADLAQKRFDYLSGKPNFPLIFGALALASGGVIGWMWRKNRAQKRAWSVLPVRDLDEIAPQRRAVCIEWKERDTLDEDAA